MKGRDEATNVVVRRLQRARKDPRGVLRPGVLTGLIVLGALAGTGLGGSGSWPVGEVPGFSDAYALGSCDVAGAPALVRLMVGWGGALSAPAVSGASVDGLPATCDGATVELQFWGNPAGDPKVPPSGDSLLSTARSTLDPCTQVQLANPVAIVNGALTLSLCPSGGPAAYADVHDLTLLTLFVDGAQVPVTLTGGGGGAVGPPSPGTGGGSGTSTGTIGASGPSAAGVTQPGILPAPSVDVHSGSADGGLLALTGAEILWIMLTGLLAIAAGALVVFCSRLRRGSART